MMIKTWNKERKTFWGMVGKGPTAWWECIPISFTTWNDTWLPHCRKRTPTEGFAYQSPNRLWTIHWTINILIAILHFDPWVIALPDKIDNPLDHLWLHGCILAGKLVTISSCSNPQTISDCHEIVLAVPWSSVDCSGTVSLLEAHPCCPMARNKI